LSDQQFRLVQGNWVDEIDRGLAEASGDIWVVSPFIKRDSARRLTAVKRGIPLHVITRYNLNDFDAGVSDLSALEELLKRGSAIRGIRGLHAKVYVFGSERAIVTSANLTEAGLLRNREFGLVTTDPVAVKACRDFCIELWKQGKTDLAAKAIQHWQGLLTAARLARKPSELCKLPDFGQQSATDGASQFGPEEYENLAADIGAFVKFFGSGDNRALRSMSILEEIARSGSHWACTYPKRPRQVADGDKMFMARMVKSPNDYMIYGEATGRRHIDDLDVASDADIQRRPWKRNWPYYVRVHRPRILNGDLANGISMNRLMAELGSKAFAVTLNNAVKGSGNTDPRRALMQQPAVKLSPYGAEWVGRELDQAYKIFGQMDLTDPKIDWPDH
jgi:hypothetical protein